MRHQLKHFSIFILLTSILFLILTDPIKSMELTTSACSIWWNRMLPTLFPFMVFSRCFILTNTSVYLGKLTGLFLKPIYRLSDQCIYIITIGYLCGFPMGAICINESIKNHSITKEEANLLLSFCNNIGPMYLISYAYSLCPYTSIPTILILIYGIPFLIGFILRHTYYKKKIPYQTTVKPDIHIKHECSILAAMNNAIKDSISTILNLLGCMIVFTIIQLPLYNKTLMFPNTARLFLTGILEISAGIQTISPYQNLYPYVYSFLLPFCGLCCLYQTFILISEKEIKLKSYLYGKLVHTFLCCIILYFKHYIT